MVDRGSALERSGVIDRYGVFLTRVVEHGLQFLLVDPPVVSDLIRVRGDVDVRGQEKDIIH